MRIFIVENHEDTLKYLRMYLETLGHSVTTAGTKSEALAAIPSADCDIFICDIGLPDGNGWDLLHDACFSRSVYAIAISGFGTTSDRQRSMEAGYRQHIVKPFGVAISLHSWKRPPANWQHEKLAKCRLPRPNSAEAQSTPRSEATGAAKRFSGQQTAQHLHETRWQKKSRQGRSSP